MKVLIDGLIFQKDPYGGIGRIFREILPRMCSMEPDLQVVLFNDGPVRGDLPAHPHISVRRTPPVRLTLRPQGPMRSVLLPFRRIASQSWNHLRGLWLRSEQQAIWHSTFYTSPINWEGPQVVTVYDMIHELFQDLYNDPLDDVARSNKKKAIDQASMVICISESTRQDIQKHYPHSPVNSVVIPLASSPSFRLLTPQENLPIGILEPYLLYVGSRAHYKNFTGLLETYRQWDGRSQTALVVVGAPWTLPEQQYLRQLGLTDRVQLLSNVDDSLLCRIYNQAQAFIFPSFYEGFGIPILEAFACGCPVVASRIPASLEVGKDCPFYFDVNKPKQFLDAISLAAQNGRRPERIQRGFKHTASFSWDQTARQTLKVYQHLYGSA